MESKSGCVRVAAVKLAAPRAVEPRSWRRLIVIGIILTPARQRRVFFRIIPSWPPDGEEVDSYLKECDANLLSRDGNGADGAGRVQWSLAGSSLVEVRSETRMRA